MPLRAAPVAAASIDSVVAQRSAPLLHMTAVQRNSDRRLPIRKNAMRAAKAAVHANILD
ncbi:MAG TPA: hypothetical protein VN706_05305 [Gemmatimonadaceae bacterium]|nr:hypothetical protein [Gemmatimonadaceae bacterium]